MQNTGHGYKFNSLKFYEECISGFFPAVKFYDEYISGFSFSKVFMRILPVFCPNNIHEAVVKLIISGLFAPEVPLKKRRESH